MEIFYYAHVDLSGESGSIGSVRHVVEVVNRLVERGHDLTVFVPAPEPESSELKTDRVVYIPSYKGYLGFGMQILFCLWAMLVRALRTPPDVIYAREMLYTFHTALVARVLSVPHVTEINGFQPEEVRTDPNFTAFLYPVLIFFEGINYWLSDRLIAVSDQTRRKVIQFYGCSEDQIMTIRNGVNTDRCRPMDQQRCREALGFAPDDLWVGFLGYLFPWSGVNYLIRAAPDILEQIPETRFMVIGSGSWGDHLPELAEETGVRERFEFTGEIDWEDVPRYLNCLDVGVSPYTTERDTLDSLKTYEYMACGLPVVTADIPEVNRIVNRNDAGLVFEPENTRDLAQKLIGLLENEKQRQKKGENARKTVVEKYDWEVTVDKTEKLLQSLR